nr:hypothetical protein CFP56_71329 [Quercus suber]
MPCSCIDMLPFSGYFGARLMWPSVSAIPSTMSLQQTTIHSTGLFSSERSAELGGFPLENSISQHQSFRHCTLSTRIDSCNKGGAMNHSIPHGSRQEPCDNPCKLDSTTPSNHSRPV